MSLFEYYAPMLFFLGMAMVIALPSFALGWVCSEIAREPKLQTPDGSVRRFAHEQD